MQQTMKALIKEGPALSVCGVAVPRIEADDEVLLKVELAGLCRTDIYAAQGKLSVPDCLILGHEFSGLVVDAGDDCSFLKPGTRVTVNPKVSCKQCKFCMAGSPDNCQNYDFIGLDRNGCFAQFIKVPVTTVSPISEEISFLAAAYVEPIAAALAVFKTGIQPHEKGLIYGSNRFSQLLQKIMLARNFHNVTVYAPKLTTDLTTNEDCRLDRNTFDFAIETTLTTASLSEMIRAIRPQGKIIIKSRQVDSVSFTPAEIIRKEPIMHVVNYGSFAEALEFLNKKQIEVDDLVDGVYELDEYAEVISKTQLQESLKPFFAPNESV
jgi:L-iditol 2-dehydrogenase